MNKKLNLFAFYLILILYLELCYKIVVYKNFTDGLIFTLFFSITIALVLYFLTKIFKTRNKQFIFTIIITVFISFLFGFNLVYYKLLDVPFSISTITLATQAIEFYKIGFQVFFENIDYILIMIIPLILLIIFNKKIDFRNYHKRKWKLFSKILISYLCSILIIIPFKQTGYKYYFKYDNLLESINYFGLITSSRLNVERFLFGFNDTIEIQKTFKENRNETVISKYEDNILNIDFASLKNNAISDEEKNLYEYLENNIATSKNEYTGMYNGKNLIFILAEGFNSIAVDEKLTPTLYKLTHTGFVFNNYYSPVFLSTTGGEFQATTSLIPTQEILNLWRKYNPSFLYSLGNTFNSLGYQTNAYHDWTYTYYKRDLTMPTLGFNNYMGCKNGMENYIDCKWLPSDIDMINKTSPLYMQNDKFMTYYISVSGHAPYNFNGGNSIAIKNEELVKDLPYDEDLKAYLDFPVPKFLMLDDGDYLALVEARVKAALGKNFSVYRSEPFFLEILPRGIDKAQCLAQLLKLLGMEREEMIACGDGFNDLSMIEFAGLGVAMEIAVRPVRNAADYVTLSNNDDGVAHVVEKFCLNYGL